MDLHAYYNVSDYSVNVSFSGTAAAASNSQWTLAQSGVPGLGCQVQSSYAEVDMATHWNRHENCPLTMHKRDRTIDGCSIAAPSPAFER
jgi:hypothetical protein